MVRVVSAHGSFRLLAVAAMFAASCQDKDVTRGNFTGFDIEIAFDASLPVQKIRVSAAFASGGALFSKEYMLTMRPDPDASTRSVPGTAVLDESAAGKPIRVLVEGLSMRGDLIASGTADVTLVAKQFSGVRITLTAVNRCSDADGGASDGGECGDSG